MKRAVICIVLSAAISSQAFAIMRPRFPVKPTPPYRGGWIILNEDSVKSPPGKASN